MRLLFITLIGSILLSCTTSNSNKEQSEYSKGVFLQNWVPKSISKPQSKPFDGTHPSNTKTIISIDYNHKKGRVVDVAFGINATTYTGNYNDDPLLTSLVSLLKPGTIRFPGGDASNMYFFNGLPNDLPSKVYTYDSEWTDFGDGSADINWKMNTQQYYDFLESANSEGMITVNYPYARYGTGPNPVVKAASEAANWVRFDNGRTKYWEIGNETYASWEGGFRIDTSENQDGQPSLINGALYGSHFRVFADSMRKAAKEINAEIFIGAVFADHENIWDASNRNITRTWNNTLAPQLQTTNSGNYADFISVHSYFLEGESTPSEIINSYQKLDKIKEYVYSELDESGVAHVPLALTEWNVTPGYQTTQVGALHAVATISYLLELEFGAANYFALKDYWRESSKDFGMFAHNDPDLPNSLPYPPFFHFYVLQSILGDTMVEIEIEGNESLIAFASSYTNGGLSVIVINPENSSQTYNLEVQNFTPDDEIYWYEVEKVGNQWTEKIAINGETNNQFSKGGPFNSINSIPAYKNMNPSLNFEIESLSAHYILIPGN